MLSQQRAERQGIALHTWICGNLRRSTVVGFQAFGYSLSRLKAFHVFVLLDDECITVSTLGLSANELCPESAKLGLKNSEAFIRAKPSFPVHITAAYTFYG